MKKTVFLSLVAGAMIFAGCGGGGGGSSTSGGSTSGGSTSGGSTSGGSTSGGTTSGGSTSGAPVTKTYTPYAYPQDRLAATVQITVNADNTWTIANDTRVLGVRAVDKNYAQAAQVCSDNNQILPSANDLLSMIKPANTTSAWADGKFEVFFTDNTIGQVANEDATSKLKVVQCMTGASIEKKHNVTADANDTVTDNNTGLTWTPFKVYDKGTDGNNTNQFRFPIANATGNLLTASEYCATFGIGWDLPTLGELRSIVYLDGTTDVKKLDNLEPTVIWTKTQSADGRNYVVKLNANGTHGLEDGNEQTNPGNASFYVTCVKR